jgi:hypothetical protein
MNSETKRRFWFFLNHRTAKELFAGILFLLILLSAGLLPKSLQAQTLLQQSNLVYQGAFRVSASTFGGSSLDYCNCRLAYNATNNSLYVVGHDQQQQVAEISIPTVVNSGTLSSLNTATVLQNFTDIAEGKMGKINAGGAQYCCSVKVGGLMVYGGKLVAAAYAYYDGSGEQVLSHFTHNLTVSTTGTFAGMYRVGNQYAGFVSGYMAPIPSAYQSSLGGPALTGNCCLAIAGQQSSGPAASVFDPANLGNVSPVPATPVVGYPSTHPLGSGWGTTNPYYNGTTQISGLVFPSNTRSVLFFGRHGTGTFCYGPGTSNPSLVGQIDPSSNDPWCYDPTDGSKGTHAYPYKYQIWAYDVNDLISVKNGTKNQYDVIPYAVWNYDLNFAPGGRQFGGAAYDPVNQKIYVAANYSDTVPSGPFPTLPVIHVFRVQGGTSISPPIVPSNLTVH